MSIVWTEIDEAPALATRSLLPIVRGFIAGSGIEIETSDISLAGRILAQFPTRLDESQRVADNLARLGELAESPEAAIIKLPNISASVPQLKAAIAELQEQGYDVPDYPEQPASEAERDIAARYAKVLGSAVNPVLRQGNSDRRAPLAVKRFAAAHPHRLGAWEAGNQARVASMSAGDFFGNEQSFVTEHATRLRIELVTDGERRLLGAVDTLYGEIVDATFMSVAALDAFYREQIDAATRDHLLLSLHLKATMMKVSDPVMFGHAVRVFFAPVFEQFADQLAGLGVDPNLGLGDLIARVRTLPAEQGQPILDAIEATLAVRPPLAMVDSTKGITNLHAPNDVIIDASLPVVVRDSGCMWNANGELQQTLAMVPDRSYGTLYQAVMDDCRTHGALDPATMGSVPNVGLMAQKAEEYGSHPTTFILDAAGVVEVTDADGVVRASHRVESGDIWRMSRVRDLPIRDWVRLAVDRARVTGAVAMFFLDADRPHDAQVLAKVRRYLPEHDTDGLDIRFAAPAEAVKVCLERIRRGEDTISVTGNVLRDYLTDLFPILELGTSAKMLSIVPLLAGGGLFETGAGGSAPKHVQQFLAENYLRWDSLGEFSALGACLEHLSRTTGNAQAGVLAASLDEAIGRFLDENRSPARKIGQIDNRGSHFYLAQYWADALAGQSDDPGLAARFAPVARALHDGEERIIDELNGVQGSPVDMGGYYHPDVANVTAAMRPSATLNAIIDSLATV